MSRRVAGVICALSVIVLALSGAASGWTHKIQRQLRLVTGQQDAYAGARSAMRTGDCERAQELLVQVIRRGGDPATTRAAAADQELCTTILTAAQKQNQPDTVLETYLDLLAASPPAEIARRVRDDAQSILARAALERKLTDVTCGRYERLLGEGILNRGEGALADYQYLVACWARLRERQPAAAKELLIAIRQQITRGSKAPFPGPESFSGGGRDSRVAVMNTTGDSLYVIFAGVNGAYRLDVPACSRACSPSGRVCASDAVRTVSMPPGDYWMFAIMGSSMQDRQNGARGLWQLQGGRSTTCVS